VHGGIGERAVDQDAVPGIRHIGELRYVMAPKQIVKGILPPLARFRRHCPPPPYQVLLRIRVACRTVAPAPGKRNRYGTWMPPGRRNRAILASAVNRVYRRVRRRLSREDQDRLVQALKL
jgi:hypothetical protein